MHRRAIDLGCLGFKVDDQAIGLNDGLSVTSGAADEGVNAPPVHPCEMAWSGNRQRRDRDSIPCPRHP